MCPACGGNNFRTVEYDFGICRRTGYHDAGVSFECETCGVTGEAKDMDAAYDGQC